MELPKYVSCRPNRHGRDYFLYRRGRGTKNAWPTLRLPDYDDLQDFALRCDQYSRLQFDGEHWQYQNQSGTLKDIKAPNPDQIEDFWKELDFQDKSSQRAAAFFNKTFAALADDYQNSQAWQDLGSKTKKEYSRYLKKIVNAWADEPVAVLNAVDVQKIVDGMKNTPGTARKYRSFLSTLIEWGIPRGYHSSNPVSHTKAPSGVNPYIPWPDWAFELFFEHAREDMKWVVYSALYTGQRLGDVLTMRRPNTKLSEISLRTEKVGLNLTIPIHSEFKQILKLYCPDNHTMLHLTDKGKPWTYEGWKSSWQRMINRDEFTRFKEERIVFHGLRKNAVCLLAESGATDQEISAIVGMSLKMVSHYSRDVNLKKLARNCFKRIQGEWVESIPETVPSAKDNLVRLEALSSKLEAPKKAKK